MLHVFFLHVRIHPYNITRFFYTSEPIVFFTRQQPLFFRTHRYNVARFFPHQNTSFFFTRQHPLFFFSRQYPLLYTTRALHEQKQRAVSSGHSFSLSASLPCSPLLSCHVLSCPVLSCPVLSFLPPSLTYPRSLLSLSLSLYLSIYLYIYIYILERGRERGGLYFKIHMFKQSRHISILLVCFFSSVCFTIL